MNIRDLGLLVRSENVLLSHGIENTEQLCQKTSRELLQYRNCGKKCINDIRLGLLRFNLTLTDDRAIDDQEVIRAILSVPQTLDNMKKDVREMQKTLRNLECYLDHLFVVADRGIINDMNKDNTFIVR